MSELILGLDCTGETYSVGLWGAAGLSLEISGFQARRALRELPEGIACLLSTAGGEAVDLAAVGVTHGPGSFTGVRLGVTVAKTVAMVAGCPVLGWDTLELLARQHLSESSMGVVAVALDARRGELYCAVFARTEPLAKLECLLPTGVREPRDFAQCLSGLQGIQLAVGSGFEAYPDLLASDWLGPRMTSRQESAPSGLRVAQLTGAEESRERWHSALSLDPVYCRRADIQVSPG